MTQTTPLHTIHRQLGASFTDFGGWDMPLKYGSELAEHRAVREAAGIFDLSHMGEVQVTGPQAGAFLDAAMLATYSTMTVGRAKYGVIVDDDAHIVDDLITYRLDEDDYLVVPNASNAPAVAAVLTERARAFGAGVEVIDKSADIALIAVQGPAAEAILLATQDDGAAGGETAAQQGLRELTYYAWMTLTIAGLDVLVARTGYTGEDGVELYVPAEHAVLLWNALSNEGEALGLQPCGLAARDSLRLEAGMPLYGHELTLETTPYDAGLGRMADAALKNKGDFAARAALEALAGAQPARVLVGLSSDQRRAAREGSTVLAGGQEVGTITSGQPSPTLGRPVALAYVDRAQAEPGTALDVDVRGKGLPFTVVELPFYRRER